TLAALGEQIDRARQHALGMPSAPLRQVARTPNLPLSFAQQRLWFLNQLDAASSAYHIPLAARLRGSLQLAHLARSLSLLVARHEALRTTFVVRAGQPFQHILPPQALP